MQTGTIWGGSTWGLGLEEKLLPQYLKEIGYETHAIGKVTFKCRVFTILYFTTLFSYLGIRVYTCLYFLVNGITWTFPF